MMHTVQVLIILFTGSSWAMITESKRYLANRLSVAISFDKTRHFYRH